MPESSPFQPWSLTRLTPPWDETRSIYWQILDHPEKSDLPDEERDPEKLRFAAGAFDGVIGHHTMKGEDTVHAASTLVSLLEALIHTPSQEHLSDLYRTVIEGSALQLADEFQNQATDRLLPRYADRVAETGRYFASGTDRREAVKFGILLLGIAGDPSDAPLLKTLGSHDEFTLFSAVALWNLSDDPELVLWELAKQVHGWGRIQIVERLHQTENREIQAWMLREGFRNSVMDEYLAATCARTGKLHEALRALSIDRPLLDGSAELLSALMNGGPADDIDDYEHAPEVLESYLRHLAQTPDAGLSHLLAVADILNFLSEHEDESWQKRLQRGWDQALRERLIIQCRTIMAWPTWRPKIEEGLKKEERWPFAQADMAARALGIDTWDIHFARVHKSPMSESWFDLMRQTDESRIDHVLAFAISIVDEQSIGVGPTETLGLGPQYAPHHVLDQVLQELPRFPGRGWRLVRAGLTSPVTRNRNMALTALLAWPREVWPAEAFPLLQKAHSLEPNPDLKRRMGESIGLK